MRIAFADFCEMDFHALSVEQKPLGGSQSAACYLARCLAQAGHDVFLLSDVSTPGQYGGVTCLSWKQTQMAELRALRLDVLVCILAADPVIALRQQLGPNVKLILWTGHAHDQPGVQPLRDPRVRQAFDGIALVSDWQRQQFQREFALDPARTAVLRNAIAPAFANLFPGNAPILAEKAWPPILTYTSTPFRGLNLLLDVFPAIRQAVPNTQLEVYSSMQVYQQEEAAYAALYQRCRQTPGVEYIGSLPQPQLAQRLRRVTLLAYPNTFAETSCIAVMEAMASGCRVITSHLGALPETTGGFARLIPPGPDRKAYLEQFTSQVIQSLREVSADTASARQAAEALLRQQVDKVNAKDTWTIRAGEWCQWLNALPLSSQRTVGMNLDQSFAVAVQHHQARRLKEAEQIYRQILAQQPNHVGALHYLGVIAAQAGRPDAAVQLIRQAITIEPNWPEAHCNLSNALVTLGQVDDAIAASRRALALNANYPEAWNNLGNALKAKGQMEEALSAYGQAVTLQPSYAIAHHNLGVALQARGQIDQAIAAFQRAIACRPGFIEAHSSLGLALQNKGLLDDAIAAFRQAIASGCRDAGLYNNLGVALKNVGQLDDAIAAFRQALKLQPDFAEVDGNLIYTMHYHPGYDAAQIAREHRRWNQQHAQPLEKFIQPHGNERKADRRLRIGYVSPDFRFHAVGMLLLPLLANHDHQNFEVFAYAQVRVPDAMTQRLRAHCNSWRSLVGLSDAQAAELIRRDGIDILVDLAGHTAFNRLLVFAHKPAPVQATYLGYPNTTGLTAIDYRLTDAYADPPGQTELYHSEQLFRLAPSAWCWQPLEDVPVPARRDGPITFSCLNIFSKLNDPLLDLWVRVLKQVPHSHLLLRAEMGNHRQRILDRLHQQGIDPGRVEFYPRQSRQSYLELHHGIDLALDSFPYHGTATTFDALWMGVPVVTLAGASHVSRVGVSLLSNVGVPELIANTPEDYVRLAVELAHDLPRLKELRSTLRQRMEQSPLMDAPRFARTIEAAYRRMWQQWCEQDHMRPSPAPR